MTLALLVLVAVIGLVALLVLTFHVVARDGYGTRPPPRSHHDPFPTVASRISSHRPGI